MARKKSRKTKSVVKESSTQKAVAHPGSALGEAVGNLIESEVHSIVAQVASRHGCHVDAGGPLADGRKGVLLEMIN